MFTFVHLAQKEGWRLDRATIAIQMSPFLTQQEQKGIISPNNKMVKIKQVRRSEAQDLIKSIKNKSL